MKNILNYKSVKILISIILLSLILLSPSIAANQLDNSLTINKEALKQGEVLTIKIDTSSPITKIFFNNETYKTRKLNGNKITLIPISYWTKPGQYTLKISAQKQTLNKSITVLSGDFDNSYLEVNQEMEEIVNPDKEEIIKKKKEDKQLINKARSSSSPQKLWSSNFIWPVQGEISTDFGAARYINNELQSRHSGIDIAVKIGTEVKATNDGVVKLANNLLVTGKTIIIDHGWNVFSGYSHLSKIDVNVGEKVKRAQKIGEIGSTGFSTGPHLHWTIKINSIYINPKSIVNNKQFILK
ncbi:MAG: M23 family metallopeptidase [Halanaerobiales bacterium]